MKFSTRTRYGLRFLIRLASTPSDRLMQLGELAREEGISPGYMEQIVRALRPLGILRSVRGAAGGYALAVPAKDINLEDLFLQLEGGIAPVHCILKKGQCVREDKCTTRQFWHALDAHMRGFLQKLTLQDLIDNYTIGNTAPCATPSAEEKRS